MDLVRPARLHLRTESDVIMPDVTIEIKAGRTQEQKDKIAKIIEDALLEIAQSPRENVRVIYKEFPA